MNYFDKELKMIQANVPDSRHIFKERHYDFTPLTEALKGYIKNFGAGNSWTSDQLDAHWCSVVGLAQHYMPAHVAQHYCNSGESFAPQGDDTPPTFKEKVLRRSLEFYNGISKKTERWWFGCAVDARILGSGSMPDSGSSPGFDFGVLRWDTVGCGGRMPPRASSTFLRGGRVDLTALMVLCKVRTHDALKLKQLIDSLQKPETGSDLARCAVQQ